ncbi:unnamed protein product [Bursaphelenchus xylophilus]|uniref:(pine wood nematode) hypothetical protein n=1 Tax=Bursaphelenchus xylophilus TaxID=6326 RepID=A0A1I7STC1_BURXY|nr:unnamed protein product [Bursaphelenchus xylophilus]CAG9108579.1 unnamed protein product [Bursaphelenchus xylophilus]
MSEYRLQRARSVAIVNANNSAALTRAYSVDNLNEVYHASPRYLPQYPTYATYRRKYTPYAKDHTLFTDYWYDKHRYFSPIHEFTTSIPRRYYNSDNISNPLYWSYPYPYWTRYNSYLNNYPYFKTVSPITDSYFDTVYRRAYYSPYRTFVHDNVLSRP